MKVPYRNKAIIDKQRKIVGYLLNLRNPDSRPKALYFRSKGFNETNINIFQERLLSVIYTQEIEKIETSPYGKKYITKGKILAPNGEMIVILTVWIVANGTRKPSFVTAYHV